jgi:hypothetical protein
VRRIALLLSITLTWLTAGGFPLHAQDGDRDVTSPPFFIDHDARFAIMFPGDPTIDPVEYTTSDGMQFPARRFSVVDGANQYLLTYVDFTSGPITDVGIVDKAVGNIVGQGEIIYESDAEYEPGVESRQLMVSYSDGTQTHASVYMWDHRMVITEAIGAPGTPSLLRFAQSLTLLRPDGGVM